MFTLETDFPVARSSPDQIKPMGNRIDNDTNPGLIEEIQKYFRGQKIYALDLGCAGGQFIVDLHERGHKALGIEGSDSSLKQGKGLWPKYHQRVLFTADLAQPFQIKESGKGVQFQSITAWGFLERLRPEDLRAALSSIEKILEKDGIFWGSIATAECVVGGKRMLQSAFSKEKWVQEVLPEYFEVVPYKFRNSINELWVRLGESFLFMCKKKGARKLNLGCGGNILPGWENHDADIDISKPLLFPDHTFDYILAEHVLEHVSVQQGYPFLKECFRILKPGGVLRICVPGVDRIFHNYSEDYGSFVQKAGFGGNTRQAAIEAILFRHGHQAAWTEELLVIFLQTVGFLPEKTQPRVSRHKELQDVDGHWKVIGKGPNAVETIAVDAVKHHETPAPIYLGGGDRRRKKIAVGLIEHLGDIVACEPVSRYLRNLQKDAEITWVVRQPYRELIDHNPHIDYALTVSCLSDWMRIVESALFDEIIDLHVNRRVCTVWGKTLNKKRGNPDVDVEKYFQYGSLLSAFCQGAGLPPLAEAPQVYIAESAVKKVNDLGLPPKFFVIHGTSNETSKDWPASKWIDLVGHLVRGMNLVVVEVGTNAVCASGEKEWGRQYFNLCGKLSILETAEVIRRAALFIGVDSGPAHLANAVGTPGILLMGEYRIYKRYMPFTGPYADPQKKAILFNPIGPAAALTVATVLQAVSEKIGISQPKKMVEPAQGLRREEKPSIPKDTKAETPSRRVPRLIAFYLPQFHPIPENNQWWGRGFTEWTNVAKGKPLFPGHYQPHVPGELGYYDLRLPETRIAQAEIAREYGLSGFCYYHYWFQGKLLLERPVREVLKTGKPDFPFCLCWANENWTRVWNGGSKDILIRQEYSEKDDAEHIRYLCEFFQDRRYIRIDGKPLFLVYRPRQLPNPLRTASIWREAAKKSGVGELFLCQVESFPEEYNANPQDVGFDASVEFQPDWYRLGPKQTEPILNGLTVFRYEQVVKNMLAKTEPPYRRFPCVNPSWDNSPRRKEKGIIFAECSPALYEMWLRKTIQKTRGNPVEEQIIFINAWNEWGEGNHLEPDRKQGRAFLEATKNALAAEGNQIANHQAKDAEIKRRNPGREAALGPCRSVSEEGMEKGLTSIIILSYNQWEYTDKCLRSIEKNTPEKHEIILVDNGSTDGTIAHLRELVRTKSQYRLVANQENCGFARGCNQGIKEAKGEFLLLLNNDVLVTERWLAYMLDCLHRHPSIGVVGPMTNQISGIQKVPYVAYRSLDRLDDFARFFHEKNRHRRIPSRRIVGFCMLMRRELIDKIGSLDENFGTGNFEDDDFCLRAELAGYMNMIAGDVFIHHYGSRSFVGNQIDYRSSMNGNRKIFFAKWNGIDWNSPAGRKLLSKKEMEAAWELYYQDHLEEAAQRFLKALKISPHDENIYLAFAQMLLDAKKYQESLDLLNQIPKREKGEKPDAFRGYCLEGLGKIEEAEEFAEKSLSARPDNALALNLTGVLAYRKGQKEGAVAAFEKAIQTDPGYGEPFTNLGVMKWEGGEKEAGLTLLERGFILSPTGTDTLQLYHAAACATGALERAEEIFSSAEALYPAHKKIQYLLMDILLRQGKNEAAMERIEKAIAGLGMDEGMISAALEVRKRIGAKEVSRANGRKTISLCMIVKNEEKYLAKCLQSIRKAVDEIIVVDTGSTDKTKELAAIFGAKVFDFAWEEDFSSARNYSLAQASGDWILVLDADERISESDHPLLRKMVEGPNGVEKAFSFVTRNYVNRPELVGFTPNEGSYPEEEGAGWTPSEKARLFPNDRRFLFENPVHEMIGPALERHRVVIQKCPVPVHHYGKLDSEREKEKGERYYSLGRKKLELKSDVSSLKELAIQAGGVGRFEEAISLWNRILALDPKMADAYINLSYNHLKQQNYEEAARLSRRARELDPNSKEALLNYASAEFFNGDMERVIQSLEDSLPECSEYPPILGLLSLAYLLEGKPEKGFPLAEKLKKMGFNYSEYISRSADDLIGAGQEQRAKSLLHWMAKNRKGEGAPAGMIVG